MSAASYWGPAVGRNSIAATFGVRLAISSESATRLPLPTDLADTTLKIIDSSGAEGFAQLFFASPGQINWLIPTWVALGPARIVVRAADGSVSQGQVDIVEVAPGLFSANATGEGPAAGTMTGVKHDGSKEVQPLARFDQTQQTFAPTRTELYFGGVLTIYGTGLREASPDLEAFIGGFPVGVLYAGPQGQFQGLDQINLGPILPLRFASIGEVDVVLRSGDLESNAVIVNIEGQSDCFGECSGDFRVYSITPEGAVAGQVVQLEIRGANLSQIAQLTLFQGGSTFNVTNLVATDDLVTAAVHIPTTIGIGADGQPLPPQGPYVVEANDSYPIGSFVVWARQPDENRPRINKMTVRQTSHRTVFQLEVSDPDGDLDLYPSVALSCYVGGGRAGGEYRASSWNLSASPFGTMSSGPLNLIFDGTRSPPRSPVLILELVIEDLAGNVSNLATHVFLGGGRCPGGTYVPPSN